MNYAKLKDTNTPVSMPSEKEANDMQHILKVHAQYPEASKVYKRIIERELLEKVRKGIPEEFENNVAHLGRFTNGSNDCRAKVLDHLTSLEEIESTTEDCPNCDIHSCCSKHSK